VLFGASTGVFLAFMLHFLLRDNFMKLIENISAWHKEVEDEHNEVKVEDDNENEGFKASNDQE